MKTIIENLTNEELKIAFNEYQYLKEYGVIDANTIVRKTLNKCKEVINDTNGVLSLTFIFNLIFEEIAYRHFNNKF
jgi:hypothetical protein